MFGKNAPWLSSFRNLTMFGNVTLIETKIYSIKKHFMSVKTDKKTEIKQKKKTIIKPISSVELIIYPPKFYEY